MEAVSEVCETAYQHQQNVLILMFGHGDRDSKGVQISIQTVQTLSQRLNVATTIISKRTSLPQGVGLLQAAEDEDHPPKALIAQGESYVDFGGTIFEKFPARRHVEHPCHRTNRNPPKVIRRIDGTHFPPFEAIPKCILDTGRTSISTVKIKTSATTWTCNQKQLLPAHVYQRHTTGITNGKRKTSGLYGGSPDRVIRHVAHVGEQYLANHQGFNDTDNDGLITQSHPNESSRKGTKTAWNMLGQPSGNGWIKCGTSDHYLRFMG
ncbi:MAG: hypothetical protein Q9172_002240 [Xanthocarpia lactea]